jgi:cytochrome c biogenesis protein CcdA
MNQNRTFDPTASKRAFHHGMMLALAVALVPVAIVSTGLFLSGYQPRDFDANLRLVLLGAWIVFLFSVDRLANLNLSQLAARIPARKRGEILTIFVLSALLGALWLEAGMGALQMAGHWLKGFALVLGTLSLQWGLILAVHRSWGRARARRLRNRARAADATDA